MNNVILISENILIVISTKIHGWKYAYKKISSFKEMQIKIRIIYCYTDKMAKNLDTIKC